MLVDIQAVTLGRHRVGINACEFNSMHQRALRALARNHRPLVLRAVEEPRLRIKSQTALLLARPVALKAMRLQDRANLLQEVAIVRCERRYVRLIGRFLGLGHRRKEQLRGVARAMDELAAEVASHSKGKRRCEGGPTKVDDGDGVLRARELKPRRNHPTPNR